MIQIKSLAELCCDKLSYVKLLWLGDYLPSITDTIRERRMQEARAICGKLQTHYTVVRCIKRVAYEKRTYIENSWIKGFLNKERCLKGITSNIVVSNYHQKSKYLTWCIVVEYNKCGKITISEHNIMICDIL